MSEPDYSALDELIEDARAMDMDVFTPKDDDEAAYDAARQVHNERLVTTPYAVVMCRDPEDFQFWFEGLQGIDVPISIRSGGHHHEAMCSNTGGVVLVSPSGHDVEFVDERHVWLGAGQRLGDVIRELAEVQRLIPTGVCATVNVGGLASGGGWGLSYRTLGPTVDRIRAVDMVLTNGAHVIFNDREWLKGGEGLSVSPGDLYWAVCGGGGGNFGAVQRLLFEMHDPGRHFTEFTLQWTLGDRAAAAVAWTKLCLSGDDKLNFFARMGVPSPGEFRNDDPPFVVTGRYYGDPADCKTALKDLLEAATPRYEHYVLVLFDQPETFARAALTEPTSAPPDADGNPLPAQAYAMQVGARSRNGPTSTCVDKPEPHKVSSAIPVGDPEAVIAWVEDYVAQIDDREGVNLYVSFHGMGGHPMARNDEINAFPWRHAPYMLQAQAWWLPGSRREDAQELVDWVEAFGIGLAEAGLSEGAFVNFPDDKLPADAYYGGSLKKLRDVKTQVDRGNRLDFLLGVDPWDT